jgi:hypothetical protein
MQVPAWTQVDIEVKAGVEVEAEAEVEEETIKNALSAMDVIRHPIIIKIPMHPYLHIMVAVMSQIAFKFAIITITLDNID